MNTISIDCMKAYWNAFDFEPCGCAEPNDFLIIDSEDGCFVQPEDETDATFMDRIERSKKAGRNLFHEEWGIYKPLDPDAVK